MKLVKLIGNVIFLSLYFISCSYNKEKTQLPYFGNKIIQDKDTLYPVIPKFSLLNQDSVLVNNQTLKGKIYIADFIFLNCPSICPKITNELERVYRIYKSNPKILFISHTIDPQRDSVAALKKFSIMRKIDNQKWFFLTGNKDSIQQLAKYYFTEVYPDDKNPENYIHGGGFILVDAEGHIRGVYDGTKTKEANRLVGDIKTLLNEN